MLAKLFGSKARVKILKLFIHHPDEKYYIRQLSRILGLQLNSIRRELDNLENFGLLASQTGNESVDLGEEAPEEPKNNKKAKNRKDGKKKNNEEKLLKNEKKYYEVNKEFILFGEIKDLIVKSQILYERDFIDKIIRIGKIRLMILTGFFANNENSLVDMLIVGSVNKKELYSIVEELEKELGREVNFTLLNTSEFRYRKDMTDVFLYNVLEGKKIVVVDDLGLI